MGGFIADDHILLLLNGSDNIFHFLVRGPAELLLQHIVIDVQRAFDHIFHFAVFDAVLSF
ncbi:hypothetical protein D3C73_887930 [compost metagenome]